MRTNKKDVQVKKITDKNGDTRKYIFFKVEFNHFRDVSESEVHEVTDRYEPRTCECVLALPKTYSKRGPRTPLILSFHGAGGRVCAAEDKMGGLSLSRNCLDAGYATLDVCGSEEHGLTMGCPEHLFAIFKAYRYVTRHYNLSERIFVAGGSMGGHTAMNFANTFPSIVLAAGLVYPRLNMDSVTIDGHFCKGTWDKTKPNEFGISVHDRIVNLFRFPSDEWYEPNTTGFNPYRTRSFIDGNGKRIVIPPCPIKIWQGLDDTTVDPVMVKEYVDSIHRAGCYAELHLLEGVAHKTTPVMREELVLWFDRFI